MSDTALVGLYCTGFDAGDAGWWDTVQLYRTESSIQLSPVANLITSHHIARAPLLLHAPRGPAQALPRRPHCMGSLGRTRAVGIAWIGEHYSVCKYCIVYLYIRTSIFIYIFRYRACPTQDRITDIPNPPSPFRHNTRNTSAPTQPRRDGVRVCFSREWRYGSSIQFSSIGFNTTIKYTTK